MELKVIKNEFRFIPDIANNKELEPQKQFVVVLKKINRVLESGSYANYEVENENVKLKSINNAAFYKSHIVKFINAPKLRDENSEVKELTKDSLFSNIYSNEDLESLLNQIIDEINKLGETGDDIKK